MNDMIILLNVEVGVMKKTISMSIRVSEDELKKLKQAARIEAYASYSEFIRRTAIKRGKKKLLKIANIRMVNNYGKGK